MTVLVQLIAQTSRYDAIAAYSRRLDCALRGAGITAHVVDLRTTTRPTLHAAVRRADAVVLQYNPFCFGRGGLAPSLPITWNALRTSSDGRFVVNVHEPHAPWAPVRWTALSLLQRIQLYALAQQSDAVSVSTQRWADEVRFPVKAVIPVGSNIASCPVGRDREAGRGPGRLRLVSFGTAHESRLYGLVESACAAVAGAGVDAELVVLGADATHVNSPLPTRHTGPLADDEVSVELAAADVMLAPFIDGVSTRRGSVIAGLQHGLAVITTGSRNTDPVLRCTRGLRLADVESFVDQALLLARDRSAIAELAAAGHQLYTERFTWERIAADVIELALGRTRTC